MGKETFYQALRLASEDQELDHPIDLGTKSPDVSPKVVVKTVNPVAKQKPQKPRVDTSKVKKIEAQLAAAQKDARIFKTELEQAKVQLKAKVSQADSLMAERDEVKAELVQVAATKNGAESWAKAAELELKRITTESDNARCPGCQALVDWAGLPIRKAPVRVWKDRRLDDEFTVLGSTKMVDYRRCPVCTYVEEVK